MYSAVGRVIMYSGALGDEDMGKNDAYKESMTGQNLANALTEKVKLAKEANIPTSVLDTVSRAIATARRGG